MKPVPAPHVPGNTDSERFDNAVRRVLSVTKREIVEHERQEPKPQPSKPAKK